MRVLPEPDGRFTAHSLGEPDLRATAATAEEAVEQLRARLQEEVNGGRLLAIEWPLQNPLLERFSSARRSIAARADSWIPMDAPIPP